MNSFVDGVRRVKGLVREGESRGGGGGGSDDVSSSVIIFILSSPFIQYIQFYSQETEIAYFHSQFGVFTNKTSPN